MSDHPDPTHRSLITSSIAFIISLKTFLFVFSQAGQGRRYCIGNIEINEQRKVIFSRIPSSGKSPDRGYFYNQSELEDNKDGRVWRERSKNYFIQLLLLLTSLIYSDWISPRESFLLAAPAFLPRKLYPGKISEVKCED